MKLAFIVLEKWQKR